MMQAILFDVETTGLTLPSVAPTEKQPRIIEFGALKIDAAAGELAALNQLIFPGMAISEQITKITKITNADLVGKPTFKEFLPAAKMFFVGADVLIAHNATFDVGLLTNELNLAGCSDFPWPPMTLCTMQEYAPLIGYMANLKDLFKFIMGVELEQTHRAIDDVRAMHQLICKDNFLAKVGLA